MLEESFVKTEADKILKLAHNDDISPDPKGRLEEFDWPKKDKEWPFRVRATSFRIIQFGLWVAFGASVIILLVSLLHLVLPSQFRWLKPEEAHALSDVLTLVTGGAIGAFLVRYFKRIFSDFDDNNPKAA